MTVDERLAAPLRIKPEMSSLNMGSMNFGLFPMLARYDEFRYEWERAHLETTVDNTPLNLDVSPLECKMLFCYLERRAPTEYLV